MCFLAVSKSHSLREFRAYIFPCGSTKQLHIRISTFFPIAQISLTTTLPFPHLPHFLFQKKLPFLLCFRLLTMTSYKKKHVYCHGRGERNGSCSFLYESGNEDFKRYQCGIVIMHKPKLSGLITSETKITEECMKCLNGNNAVHHLATMVMGRHPLCIC